MEHARIMRDEGIRHAVMDRLSRLPCLDARELQLRVQAGRVTLLGWAPSEEAIAAIVGATREAPGVSAVVSELQLSPRPSFRSDEEVASHVLGGIGQDADIDTERIRVGVVLGDVLLTGWVANREQARNAEANAWWTVGVLNVINHLHVGSEPVTAQGPDDRAIAEALLNQLIHSPRVSTREVMLSVDRGIVTVWGTVPSGVQRQAVSEIAGSMPGVTQVINRLASCERVRE
ncbi:periplasmic protein [compost metagenome]